MRLQQSKRRQDCLFCRCLLQHLQLVRHVVEPNYYGLGVGVRRVLRPEQVTDLPGGYLQ